MQKLLIAIGVVVWRDLPSPPMLGGCLLLVGAGIGWFNPAIAMVGFIVGLVLGLVKEPADLGERSREIVGGRRGRGDGIAVVGAAARGEGAEGREGHRVTVRPERHEPERIRFEFDLDGVVELARRTLPGANG